MGDAANLGLLCPACFYSRPDSGRCSRCGWLDGDNTVPPFHLPLGTVLGNNYILGKALGQGGFGITYVAWDPALQVRRAIKEYYPIECAARAPNQHTISPYTGEAEDNFSFGLDRFMDEAQKLAKFQDHPHIVTVLGYFRDNHTAYMVMDYLPGKTLENYLRGKGGRIPYSTAKDIMVRVMDALRAVHESNLLHRDVSPQNIYITDDGKVKLLDFGSARQATGSHSQSLSLMIKHGYSPAEQYSKTGHQAAWTDVYATGATFYRAITGEIPPEALLRMKSDPLRPLSEFCDDVPERAERAILKALAVDSEDRFQTIKAFQDEIVAPDPPPPPPRPQTKGDQAIWKKAAIALGVLCVLAAGGYMYFELMDQRAQLEQVRLSEEAKEQLLKERLAADAEAQRKADAEAQRKADAEAQRKANAEAQRKADAEAQRKADAEAQREADAEAQMQRALVRDAQYHLNRLGYDPGPADGLQGRKTTEAVRMFQAREGMRPDGAITETLVTSLRSATPERTVYRPVEPPAAPPGETVYRPVEQRDSVPPPFDPNNCPPSNRSVLENVQFYAGILNSAERPCEVYEYCKNRPDSIFQDVGKGSVAVPCSRYR